MCHLLHVDFFCWFVGYFSLSLSFLRSFARSSLRPTFAKFNEKYFLHWQTRKKTIILKRKVSDCVTWTAELFSENIINWGYLFVGECSFFLFINTQEKKKVIIYSKIYVVERRQPKWMYLSKRIRCICCVQMRFRLTSRGQIASEREENQLKRIEFACFVVGYFDPFGHFSTACKWALT